MDICRITGLHHRELLGVHEVTARPPDLATVGIAPLILHRRAELPPRDQHRLVLVDLQVHDNWPSLTPTVTRRVYILPPRLWKDDLLRRLRVVAYCRRVRKMCLLWHNLDIVDSQQKTPVYLEHGDFLQVAIPPYRQKCPVPTQRAIQFAEEGLHRNSYGKRCREEPQPDPLFAVPGPPTRMDVATQEPDHLELRQTHLHFGPVDRLGDDDTVEGGSALRHCRDDPLQVDPDQELAGQIQGDHEQDGAADSDVTAEDDQVNTVAAEDFVPTFATWFVRGGVRLRCPEPLFVRPRSLDRLRIEIALRQRWDEWVDPALPLHIYAVNPSPPLPPGVDLLPHIIAVQDPPLQQSAILTTALVEDVIEEQFASLEPTRICRFDIIEAAYKTTPCYTEHLQHECQVSTGAHTLEADSVQWTTHGQGFVLQISRRQDYAPPTLIRQHLSVFWPNGNGQEAPIDILRQIHQAHFPHEDTFPVHSWFINHQGPLSCRESRLAPSPTHGLRLCVRYGGIVSKKNSPFWFIEFSPNHLTLQRNLCQNTLS